MDFFVYLCYTSYVMKETLRGTETKQKILDCSLDLFASRGYAGTSMNDIIEKLGISKGSVYWHFKSKEEWLNANKE